MQCLKVNRKRVNRVLFTHLLIYPLSLVTSRIKQFQVYINGHYLRNRSALAVNCWVMIHCLEVKKIKSRGCSASDLSSYNWRTHSELLLNNSRSGAHLF